MKKDPGFWSRWLLALIILTSFYHFSFYFSPLLNSDSALGILMGQYLQLPQDLYCWGQDRGGNFIPMLAGFVHNFSGIPLIVAISLIHYSILIAGYFGFAHLLKSDILKMVLAVFWFLPPWQFVEFLLYPYGIQYSILGIIIYLLFIPVGLKSPGSKVGIELITGIVATIGLWISDFLAVSLLSLFLAAIWYKRKWILTKRSILLIAAWILISGLFIAYGKLQSVPSHNYTSFNIIDTTDLRSSLAIVWQSIWRILIFNSESDIQSMFWWLVILIGLYYTKIKPKENVTNKEDPPTKQFVIRFLLINTCLTLLALLSSKWVLANEMGRRYFTTLFISVALLILYQLDQKNIRSTILRSSIILAGILSILSAIENFYSPKFKKSKTDYVRQVSTLAPAGVIGDYWNSYVYSSTRPLQLITTPHDKSTYRNIALVEKVFAQPNLYLVKDMWFKTFPDTIRQFGRILIKDGQEFHLGDSDFCHYRLDSNYYHFSYRSSIPTSVLLKEKVSGEKVIDITKFRFNGYSTYDSLSPLKQVLVLSEFDAATYSRHAKTAVDLDSGAYEVQISLRLEDKPIGDNPESVNINISIENDNKIIVPVSTSSLKTNCYTRIGTEISISDAKGRISIELTGSKSIVLCDQVVIREK